MQCVCLCVCALFTYFRDPGKFTHTSLEYEPRFACTSLSGSITRKLMINPSTRGDPGCKQRVLNGSRKETVLGFMCEFIMDRNKWILCLIHTPVPWNRVCVCVCGGGGGMGVCMSESSLCVLLFLPTFEVKDKFTHTSLWYKV